MEALEGFGVRYNLLWKLWKGLESGITCYGSLEGFGVRYSLLWKLWKGLETGITCYGSFVRVWRQV